MKKRTNLSSSAVSSSTDVANLASELRKLRQQVQDMSSARFEETTENRYTFRSMQDEIQSLRSAMNTMSNFVGSELDAVRREMQKEMESSRREWNGELESVREQTKRLARVVRTTREETTEWMRQYTETLKEISRRLDEHGVQKNEVEDMRLRISDLMKSTETQKNFYSLNIRDVKGDVDKLSNRLVEIDAKLQTFRLETDACYSHGNDSAIEEIRSRMNSWREETLRTSTALAADLSSLTSSVRDNRLEAESKSTQLREFITNSLEETKTRLLDSIDRIHESVQRQSRRLDDVEKQNRNLSPEIVTQVGQVTAQQNQIIESTSEATRQSLDFVQTQQKKLAEAVQASISELQREIIGIQATVAAMERFRRIPDFPSTFVPSIQLSSSGNVPSAADAFSAASVLSSTPSVPYQPWTLGGEYKNPSTFSTFPSSGSIRTGGVSRLASPTIPS